MKTYEEPFTWKIYFLSIYRSRVHYCHLKVFIKLSNFEFELFRSQRTVFIFLINDSVFSITFYHKAFVTKSFLRNQTSNANV